MGGCLRGWRGWLVLVEQFGLAGRIVQQCPCLDEVAVGLGKMSAVVAEPAFPVVELGRRHLGGGAVVQVTSGVQLAGNPTGEQGLLAGLLVRAEPGPAVFVQSALQVLAVCGYLVKKLPVELVSHRGVPVVGHGLGRGAGVSANRGQGGRAQIDACRRCSDQTCVWPHHRPRHPLQRWSLVPARL